MNVARFWPARLLCNGTLVGYTSDREREFAVGARVLKGYRLLRVVIALTVVAVLGACEGPARSSIAAELEKEFRTNGAALTLLNVITDGADLNGAQIELQLRGTVVAARIVSKKSNKVSMLVQGPIEVGRVIVTSTEGVRQSRFHLEISSSPPAFATFAGTSCSDLFARAESLSLDLLAAEHA